MIANRMNKGPRTRDDGVNLELRIDITRILLGSPGSKIASQDHAIEVKQLVSNVNLGQD